MRGARMRMLWPGPLPRSSPSRLPSAALRNFFTASQSLSAARSQLPVASLAQRTLFLVRSQRSIFARRFHAHRPLRTNGSKPNPAAQGGSSEAAPSLSARLKKLTREYGWSALGVYFALSALDFPFCFLAVRALGTDRIGHYEHVVVEFVKNLVGMEQGKEGGAAAEVVNATTREGELGYADDIEEAEAQNTGASASIWTQLALAYAIHKSFIFFRIPLTAAVTPKVVKTLRGWGWNIGKRTPKTTPKSP